MKNNLKGTVTVPFLFILNFLKFMKKFKTNLRNFCYNTIMDNEETK